MVGRACSPSRRRNSSRISRAVCISISSGTLGPVSDSAPSVRCGRPSGSSGASLPGPCPKRCCPFRIICWAIDWVIRLPGLLLCFLGIEPPKFLGVCVKILADSAGNPAIPIADVRAMMRDAAAIFRRCNINLVVCSFEVVIKPEFMTSTTCDFSGMFRRFFSWFSSQTCGCCSTVTVYFVQDIVNPPGLVVSGCAYPGTDWVTVDAEGDGTVVVQEIGHLADLWSHSSDPNNVMTDQGGGTHDQITDSQCCMIRTSRFAKFSPPCDLSTMSISHLKERLEHSIGEPFKRKERGRATSDLGLSSHM